MRCCFVVLVRPTARAATVLISARPPVGGSLPSSTGNTSHSFSRIQYAATWLRPVATPLLLTCRPHVSPEVRRGSRHHWVAHWDNQSPNSNQSSRIWLKKSAGSSRCSRATLTVLNLAVHSALWNFTGGLASAASLLIAAGVSNGDPISNIRTHRVLSRQPWLCGVLDTSAPAVP